MHKAIKIRSPDNRAKFVQLREKKWKARRIRDTIVIINTASFK